MFKSLMSTVLAATLALGATTAPVMADERTDRIIAGALILGIIGAGLSQRRDRSAPEVVHQPQRDVVPLVPQWQYQPRDRHVESRQHRRALPAQCLRRYQTRDGGVRLFDGSCLEEHYRGYRRLPLDCAVTIRSHGRFESGFAPRCLRRAGYEMAGR